MPADPHLDHLFCSDTMSLPNSAELIFTTAPPCSSSRFWNVGWKLCQGFAVEARNDVRRRPGGADAHQMLDS